jgi:L-alanine-DL-glutamate epimerase-like enolase superfamily enzyme
MSVDEVIAASRSYIDQGLMGIKIKVGGQPQEDADRLGRVREIFGEDIWLGVDANQRYDYNTALAMGHFYEEEIGVDWFEEPMSCEDVDGHRRLADKLEVPIALGESLFGPDEFERYLANGAVDIVQPDVTRVGGLTPFLKIAALVERQQRPITPHLLPEVGVHLACGLPHVLAVEYMPWLSGLFVEPPALVQGKLVPPKRPGLGLEMNADVLEKYRVNV